MKITSGPSQKELLASTKLLSTILFKTPDQKDNIKSHLFSPTFSQQPNSHYKNISKFRKLKIKNQNSHLKGESVPNNEAIIDSDRYIARIGRETTGPRLLVSFSELHSFFQSERIFNFMDPMRRTAKTTECMQYRYDRS